MSDDWEHVVDDRLNRVCYCVMQDAATPLRLDNCSKLDSGKFSLIEPLDSLLSCVSCILLLQPHGKPDRPSDFSLPCFGFSLSQENEVMDLCPIQQM